MTLPSLVKTYKFDVNKSNTVTGAIATTLANTMYGIKASMTGASGTSSYTDAAGASVTLDTAARWTVSSSSDGSTAGATDKWASAANVVWNNGAAARSWIVLRNTNIAALTGSGFGFEICLDMNNASVGPNYMTLGVAPNGYNTNGTTTARPTPVQTSGEIVLINQAPWGPASVDAQNKIHLIYSTDGQCFWMVLCQQNLATGLWFFGKAQNPVSPWLTPAVALALGSQSTQQTSSSILQGSNWKSFLNASVNSANLLAMFTTGETAPGIAGGIMTASTTTNTINDLTSEYLMLPMGLAYGTAPFRGRHGSLFDSYWGSEILATGTTYPNSSARNWVQFGTLILPWNSTIPAIA